MLPLCVPAPEKTIISRIRRLARSKNPIISQGIGDDCAILQPKSGQDLLVTTDFSLEGTHFRREWHPAESVGHRCLARGLSDIAAMGGDPVAAFLSLALPSDLPQKWVDDFLRGFLKLAKRFNVTLAGGDIAESRSSGKQSAILADVMVLGFVPKGKAIRRSTARPGDIIYVTGALGGSAATLQKLMKHGNAGAGRIPLSRSERDPVQRRVGTRHFYPEPRIEVAQYLRERKLATAMIDLSDGLSTDLAHICEESKCGASLVADLVPIAKGADAHPGSGLELALHGGEDYELLFTARKSARIPVKIAGVPVTEIGWITKEKNILITDCKRPAKRLLPKGWEHFSRTTRSRKGSK